MNRTDLKQSLLRGGLYLALRQVLILLLSLASLLLVTRVLGPERYGWVIIAISYTTFVTSLAGIGLKIYLIRKPGDCSKQLQSEILTFLLLSSSIAAAITVSISPIIAAWTHTPNLQLILIAMAPAIILDACAGVPLGMLERDLKYQHSGIAEIGSLLVYYAAVIFLVSIGWNVWAVVVAFLLQSLFQTVVAFAYYPLRPRWFSDFNELRKALNFGLGFSSAMWIVYVRGLLVPILLGTVIGTSAVGLVGATTRIAEAVAFIKAVTWQLGISGFAKLQDDMLAMKRALTRSMTYQTILLILALGMFACFGPTLIPLVLGHKWSGVIELFPFISLVVLFKGIFDLPNLVLISMGHNLEVTKFNLVNLITFCGAILILGYRFQLQGYIAAEMVCLVTYVMLCLSISRIVGSPNYQPSFWLVACTIIPIFAGNHLSIFLSVPFLLLGISTSCMISSDLRAAIRELITLVIQQILPNEPT